MSCNGRRTILLSVDPGMKAKSVSHGKRKKVEFKYTDRQILVNVAPVSGEIKINLEKVPGKLYFRIVHKLIRDMDT